MCCICLEDQSQKTSFVRNVFILMTSRGIINRLKQSKDPCVNFPMLQQHLRLSAKLAELRTRIRFLDQCVNDNQFPKHFWKILRRNRIKPTSTALIRHSSNERDTIDSYIPEMERKIAQCAVALDELPIEDRTEFESYVATISEKRSAIRLQKLSRNINLKPGSSDFPTNPERFVHNFSSVELNPTLLQALSLGPKYCCPTRKVSQADLEIQFENLHDQCADLVACSDAALENMKSSLVNSCYQY